MDSEQRLGPHLDNDGPKRDLCHLIDEESIHLYVSDLQRPIFTRVDCRTW